MAITLLTGLPGNAKTLYALSEVRKRALAENRPVFYARIPELRLDWNEIEPDKWYDAPPRSIVVIDEAQEVFRNRTLSAKPPEHVTALEVHRHKGIDLFLITQHPSLVDPAIRKLTQVHIHMVRVFGLQMSTVHTWLTGVNDNCHKEGGRKTSEKKKWAFDKSLYGMYKSAEAHTVSAKLPLRLKLLFLAPVAVVALGWVAYKYFVRPTVTPPAAVVAQAPRPISRGAAAPDTSIKDPLEDVRDYVAENTERVRGLPHTAPKYDELTKPTRVPVPTACILSEKKGCTCYSQQGTRMSVEYAVCRGIVQNGFFLDFDPNGSRDKSDGPASHASQVVDVNRIGRDAPAVPADVVAAGNAHIENPPPRFIASRGL
jgi:zona occludens toxin